ncbi:phosphate/phosphite/phosphonate ABC transporter substrate-binding protein [Sporomusa sphaeroides]|uniref:substrate-binding domain-containing protein n=1 Tax=Sporomusa sphaeroides TaxID=47679 RepID=UPI002B50F376|nr:phosphate/phosphite/phosphonate ABC transporter substrate-binding protein [Sporomusa sphaeroides]HML32001.1 phosphate/phosphite/phosphonate ABC transporter substrate-binding protein [Sporomusa sphaeroides]
MRGIAILATVLFFMAGIVGGCAGIGPPKQVRLQNTEPTGDTTNSTRNREMPLRVAVSSILSPRETLTVYQPLLEYLEAKLGQQVVLLQRKTYKEVNEILSTGNADIAFVCSGNYAASSQQFGMELLVVPQVNGQHSYQSYIIAQKDISAQSLADLKGRSFAFTDPLSFSGRIAPVYMIVSQGLNIEHFFGRTFFTYSHDNSITAVNDGIVEAAAVDSMIFDQTVALNPNLANTIKIIDRSIAVGTPPVVANPKLPEAQKERLRQLLLSIHEDPSGQKALAALHYDKFVTPEETRYTALKQIWLTVQEKL